jgi:hypothetical protein
MVWSADYRLELPLRMKKFGHGSEQPLTLVDKFQETVSKYGDRPALSVKRENKWYPIKTSQANNHLQAILLRSRDFRECPIEPRYHTVSGS